MNQENQVDENNEPIILPTLPLRGISVFPGMLLNFDVERPMSIAALNAAMSSDQNIFLVAQRDIAMSTPKPEDLYSIGTISRIKQILRIPGSSSVRVMVQGLTRAKILEITAITPCFHAKVEPVPDEQERASSVKIEAMIRQSAGLLDEYIQLSSIGTPDLLVNVMAQDDPGYVADYITQNIFLKHTQKQIILEEAHPVRRLAKLNKLLTRELDILSIEQSLQESAQQQINKNQKDYYLREQLKAIQAELGEGEDPIEELDEYSTHIQSLGLAKEVEEKLLKEVSRLSKQPFGSTEASVIRNYLDVCLDLPWNIRTREVIDIDRARKILDDDHFGLEKVKERIIEFLAVKKLAPAVKGDILCLVGPPGTGKTSIALSIAHATARKLARISLGGVHDEAEIRGHRKTYVGAMPGRIISGMQQAGSMNPVLVLDEIDKLGSDYRGDPSSALLEALDAEQNYAFRDHFLEVPFDLSSVFFIATANTTETIPRPLLDRMEVIELSSYTDEEKLEIAKRHLLPKQRKKHGLNGNKLRLSDDAIREIISLYTRESGVRVLERMIASICRKTATGIVDGRFKTLAVRAGGLEPLLGVPRYKPAEPNPCDEVGLVQGLAWTSVGGEVLELEASVVDGSGKLELTGNLGDVMKESAKAAITYIRSRAGRLGIDPDFYKNKDIHIHFPEGAVPKDGPSAGITICIGLISALTGIPVRRNVAMTGEITLRGRILPIGGLREKTMAALRNGIETVIIPAANEKDLEDIDQTVRSALKFVTTDHVDKILDVALNRHIKASSGFDADIIPPECREGKSPVAIRQ
ncbi:MAG: endopeptidase La [Oscillospiraceae bacterium]